MDDSLPKRKILRLVESNVLTSADVFEENFKDACLEFTDISYEHPQQFVNRIIAKGEKLHHGIDEGQSRFESETSRFDYISPGYGGFHLLPLLHLLRKNSTIRLLFIAHSPAQHVVELALVSGRLRTGDVIICPSNNARKIIASHFPDLEPFCIVIPHAMPPLSSSINHKRHDPKNSNLKTVVSLCRIAEDKLIHRQLDALAILHSEGHQNVRMEIAGACHDENGKPLSYVNELKARIKRLGLDEFVIFRGAINKKEEKALFLQEADALINLSRTEEESFGKSCAEAIALGVPVITTYWNGLPETVGECGTCVHLVDQSGQLHFDVVPCLCAEAIYKNLYTPPPHKAFIKQSRKFSIHEVSRKYKAALFDSGQTNPITFEKKSLLMGAPLVLHAFSHEDMDDMYLSSLGIDSKIGGTPQEHEKLTARWNLIAGLLFHTTRGHSKELLSHRGTDEPKPDNLNQSLQTLCSLTLLSSDEWIRNLLSSSLVKCGRWERGVLLSQLAVQIPALLPWANTILNSNRADNFQLIVAAHCLSLIENKVDFQAHFLSLLNRRDFSENDAPILLYLYKQVRKHQVFNELHTITGMWLKRYPDAPGSGTLWAMTGPRLIVETKDRELRNELLAMLKAVLPKFDMSRIEVSHNTIDLL